MMSRNTLTDQIKQKLQGKLELAYIGNKMTETRLRWFGYVQSRLIDETVRKSDSLEIIRTSRRETPKN